jgi:hypothetical protein
MKDLANSQVSLNGDVFIIPNNFYVPNEEDGRLKDYKAWSNELGCEMNQPWVQVWATNDESDNWTDGFYHKELAQPELTGFRPYFPHHLPLSMFAGKKEGDKVSFKLFGADITLKLNQGSYRYKRFGRFEEVLEKLAA